MKNFKYNKIRLMACFATLMTLLATGTRAVGLAESNIGAGIMNLLNDVGTFVLVLCPIVCAVVAVVFVTRRGMADEADGKMWNKRISIAIICGVCGALVGGFIKILSSYFV